MQTRPNSLAIIIIIYINASKWSLFIYIYIDGLSQVLGSYMGLVDVDHPILWGENRDPDMHLRGSWVVSGYLLYLSYYILPIKLIDLSHCIGNLEEDSRFWDLSINNLSLVGHLRPLSLLLSIKFA